MLGEMLLRDCQSGEEGEREEKGVANLWVMGRAPGDICHRIAYFM